MSSLHSYLHENEDIAYIAACRLFKKYLINSSFIRVKNNEIFPRGRISDASYFLSRIKYDKCKVLEVGARDSLLGAYLTDKASNVTLIDYFESWGKGTSNDLGSLEQWKKVWSNAAINKDNLQIEQMDILNMSFPDKSFDIVIAFSVLDHMKGQTKDADGHLLGLRELERVCTDEGRICISVSLSNITKSISGVYLQNIETLKKWIDDCNLEIVLDEGTQLDKLVQNTNKLYNINEFYPVCDVFLVLKKRII